MVPPYSSTMRFSPRHGIQLIEPKPRTDSLLKVLWRKVVEFIKKVWNTICFWRHSPHFQLNDRQVQWIHEIAEKVGLRHKNVTPINSEEVSDFETNQFRPPQEVLPLPKTEPLNELCAFIEGFSQVLVQGCVFDTKIKPELRETKNDCLEKVDQLKDWVDTIDNIIPLMEKIGILKSPLATVVFQQTLKALLTALGDEKVARTTVEALLRTNFAALKETMKITEKQHRKLHSLIDPTLNWIFSTDNWLIHSSDPMQLHNLQIDAVVFVKTFKQLLDNGTFNETLDNIKAQIDKTLEQDVKEFLEINTKPISTLISNRIAVLIENLPFTNAFDTLIQSAFNHTEGWIAANSHLKAKTKAVLDAKNDLTLRATNAATVDKQKAAEKLSHTIELEGGEKAFLLKEFHKAFALHPACHPIIEKIIEEDDPENHKRLEEEACRKIAEKWLNFILPHEERTLPDGNPGKINGINRILEGLILPENLEKLKCSALEIFHTVLEQGEFTDKKNFETCFFEFAKFLLVGHIQNKAQQMLTDILLKIKDKVSNKKAINEIAANLTIPAIIDKTFESWTTSTMQSNIKTFGPLFHKMLLSDNPRQEKSDLLVTLWKLMSKNLVSFRLQEAEIDEMRFNTIMEPTISGIYAHLSDTLKTQEKNTSISVGDVNTALQQYFQTDNVNVIPIYGEITKNALFMIGNMGGFLKENIIGWLQNTISSTCSTAMHNIRKDYRLTVTKSVQAAAPSLLNPTKVHELFFAPELIGEELKEKQKETKATLRSNVQILSKVVQGYLYRSIESHWFGGIAAYLLTPGSKDLDDLISDIYKKLLSKPLLNKNMLLRIIDIANKNIEESINAMQFTPEQMHQIALVG